MIFLYDDNASKECITLKGEQHKYLVKVRRHKEGDLIALRRIDESDILYEYLITQITPRSLELQLQNTKQECVKPKKQLHIGWCVIDSKSVEKVLPSLNEMGVGKITFIYCDRSQKNFKPDFKRYQRILESSNQQCGRSDFMQFVTCNDLGEFVAQNPEVKVFDFCDKSLDDYSEIETVLIGCEGGFSPKEKELLSGLDVFRLDTPLVLRSESATLAVAAKVLL